MNDTSKDKGTPEQPGTISVTVYYQSKEETDAFKPSDTIESVLDWALRLESFAIDPAMADEFELARHGIKEELPLSDHLGRLATGAKQLALDLVRGDMANGTSA